MKLSELIDLLEQRKEEYGDIRVAKYDHKVFMVLSVEGTEVYWDEDDQPYVEIN